MVAGANLRLHRPDGPPAPPQPHRTLDSLKDEAAAHAEITGEFFKVLDFIARADGFYGDESPTEFLARRSHASRRTVQLAIAVMAAHGFLLAEKNGNGHYVRVLLNLENVATYKEACRREVDKDPRCRARRGAAGGAEPIPAPLDAPPSPSAAQMNAPAAPIRAPQPAPSHACVSKFSYEDERERTSPAAPTAGHPERLTTEKSRKPIHRAITEWLAANHDPEAKLTPRMESPVRPPALPVASTSTPASRWADGLLARFDEKPAAEAAWSIAESLGVRWGDMKDESLECWSTKLPLVDRAIVRELLIQSTSRKIDHPNRFFSAKLSDAVRDARKKPAPGHTRQSPPGAGRIARPRPMSNRTRESTP